MLSSFRGKMIAVMISYTIVITVFSGILFYEGLHKSENSYLKSVINYHFDTVNQQSLPVTPKKLDLNTTLYRLSDADLPAYVSQNAVGHYEHEMTELHYRIAVHQSGEKIVITHEDVAKLLDRQEAYLEGSIIVLVIISIIIGSILVSYLVVLMTRRIVSLSVRVDKAIESGDIISRRDTGSTDEIANLEDALAGYSEKLMRFIEREKHFTRHASHELRTPISVIRNSYHLLVASELSDKQKKIVERIGKSSEKAKNLTSAFLMLARHHSQSKEDVRLDQLIRRILKDNQAQLGANAIEVSSDLTEVCLSSYKPLLEILISNVIVNVINHGVDFLNINLTESEMTFVNGLNNAPKMQGFGIDICRQVCDFSGYEFSIEFAKEECSVKINFNNL